MSVLTPTYVIGDIHGQLRALERLLRHEHLVDDHLHWSGGDVTLWFMGDLVDRGAESIAVVDFVMRLQQEAPGSGGYVDALLGNHELMMLAAYQFGRRSTGLSSNFITRWRRNGGVKSDLAKLTQEHLRWFAERPAMAQVGSDLLVHSDATFYTRYGHSQAEVNETLRSLLRRSNALAWEELIESFTMRGVFYHQYAGSEFIDRFLSIFGGHRIIHGHTPINKMLGGSAKKITRPFSYADGRCVNVDGGIYLGGPGFVYPLQHPLEE